MEELNHIAEETVYNCSSDQALTVIPPDLFCRLLKEYDSVWATRKFGYFKILDETQWDKDGTPCRIKEPGEQSISEFIACAIKCHQQISSWGYVELHKNLVTRCEEQGLLVGNKYPTNIDEVIDSLKSVRLLSLAHENLLSYFAMVHIIIGNCVSDAHGNTCTNKDWVHRVMSKFLSYYKGSVPTTRCRRKHCLEKLPYYAAAKDVRQRIARMQDQMFGCSFRTKKLRGTDGDSVWKKVELTVQDRPGFVIFGWIRYASGDVHRKNYCQKSVSEVVWVAKRDGITCEDLVKEVRDYYKQDMIANPKVNRGIAGDGNLDDKEEVEESDEEGEEGSKEPNCDFKNDIAAHINSGRAGFEAAEDGQSAISNWTQPNLKSEDIGDKLPAIINVPTNKNVALSDMNMVSTTSLFSIKN